jgi:hypothetical protein
LRAARRVLDGRAEATMTRILSVLAIVCSLAAAARADGTWQSPDTLAGLVGTYARLDLAQAGEMSYVSFGGSDGYRAQGPYTRFVAGENGVLTVQTGNYLAIGNNPAIGPIMTFLDEAGEVRDNYAILGLRRDALGQKIIALELVAPDGKIIALYRVGL